MSIPLGVLVAPAGVASVPDLGRSVSTDSTKSPGLLRLSRTKKVQGVALACSKVSAAGPERCPWYHLEKRDWSQKEREEAPGIEGGW